MQFIGYVWYEVFWIEIWFDIEKTGQVIDVCDSTIWKKKHIYLNYTQIDGSTDRRCFAIVTNERALLSRSDQPVRKLWQTPYCLFQAGKQTLKDRHICAMVWCIVNIGNRYELNNNNGKTDWNI